MAATWSYSQEPPIRDLAEFPRHIHGWFDEFRAFDPRHLSPFKFKKKLGHYTQMAWADTRLVGCGYAYFLDRERGYMKTYVCNYGPT